jgi:hypothetical protein
VPLIWLYEKDHLSLRLETRYDNRALQYVLVIHRPDGTSTENYEKLEEFRQRLLALEKSLAGDEWRRSGPPTIDPAGWPDDPPPE